MRYICTNKKILKDFSKYTSLTKTLNQKTLWITNSFYCRNHARRHSTGSYTTLHSTYNWLSGEAKSQQTNEKVKEEEEEREEEIRSTVILEMACKHLKWSILSRLTRTYSVYFENLAWRSESFQTFFEKSICSAISKIDTSV